MAPAGSGKTTTLVARMAWLVDGGVAPATIAAITFNKRAAEELAARLDDAVAPLGIAPGTIRVRTFHALGREILRAAGVDVSGLLDRADLLADLWPDALPAEHARLDTAFSRLKLDLAVSAAEITLDPEAGPTARAFVTYERTLRERGALDFDDLVSRSLDLLQRDPAILASWRERCAHLLVDEVQDVDRSQLRLALLLAAPANRIFLVGDDDQSIYGWRLADVRRILSLDADLPGLRRVDLEVNHRCPIPVIERAVRLIEHNRERFAKVIRARPDAVGRLVLAPDDVDEPARTERLLRSWPDDDGTRAVLARIEFATEADLPLLIRIGALRGAEAVDGELVTALLAWAPPYRDLSALRAAIESMRARLADLRREDARLSLATAHSTKGAEFDHVVVVGMDEGRFPSGRAIREADDPLRAMEEERRLGYVAWTRARRTLTLSYDPGSPSPFLLEAFSAAELGLPGTIPR